MLYTVRDHAPNHADIPAFLWRLQEALEARAVALQGITTDGSALSPAPIRDVLGEVPHQLCTFQGIAALVKGVRSAVAAERKRLATAQPQWKRGRPSSKDTAARRLAPNSQSMQETRRAVFEGRCVFVQRQRTPSERTQLLRITCGLPHLRTLRERMEHIAAWCDRRCRTPPALSKLQQRRHWVKRFRWMGDT